MTKPTPESLGVSRETFQRLQIYVDLLSKWNPRINLVAQSTLEDAWTRHIQDSLQILSLAPYSITRWADLGSGGGFPGLVVAIALQDRDTGTDFVLVESDQRKCSFLRTVIRETGISARVLSKRIEAVEPLRADVVSARALASLDSLLGFALLHGTLNGVALFPKGERWEKEVQEAQARWAFDLETSRSETESKAVVLKIGGLARV